MKSDNSIKIEVFVNKLIANFDDNYLSHLLFGE